MAKAAVYHLYTLLSIVRLTPVAPEGCIQSARLPPINCPGFLHFLIETLKGKKDNVLQSNYFLGV